MLWNQAIHTDRDVKTNRPYIILKNKKRENMHTDGCGITRRQTCCAKGSGKEVKIQAFMYRDTTNVEPEMYDCTGNNWSHWNSDEKLKEKIDKRLGIEINRMCNLKCTIIPVIIGTTGIVRKSLRKNFEAMPGKRSIDSLQKTAILGTSHIIRKVLQCEA